MFDSTLDGEWGARLRDLGWPRDTAEPVTEAWARECAGPGLVPARVTAVTRWQCQVHDGRQLRRALCWPTLQMALQVQGDALVVGDWVGLRPDETGGGWVMTRLPAANRLWRREPSGRRQPLVANVDTALLLMGCGSDFNLRRLDRYLALVRLAGVSPVVVLTQADRHPDPAARVAAVHAHLGPVSAPVLALDTRQASSAQALRAWLAPGRTLVMLGSSGTGKTTLTATLCRAPGRPSWPVAPAATDPTPAVAAPDVGHAPDGQGRHSTTTRTLHRCAGGACIIDTPGLRGLQLDVEPEALDSVFEDVTALAVQCRFRNCRHGNEPGCAVRPVLAPDRLLSWHKLQREARRPDLDRFERQAQLAEWKARSRRARAARQAWQRGEPPWADPNDLPTGALTSAGSGA